jgi:tetraprenyl-beta-curcumene synthase
LQDGLRELAAYPRFVLRVLPLVERELREWREAARAIPDAELRTQALASIEKKKFHCSGGSVLALLDTRRLPELVRAIVAIQTVSDYLDNLCDRSASSARLAGSASEGYRTYMLLHEAMLCAVDPDRQTADYYAECGQRDGGYLGRLVEASRKTLRGLPGYPVAKPLVSDLVRMYSELQSIKHLSPAIRDGLMEQWFRARWKDRPPAWLSPDPAQAALLNRDLTWWEFGAAAGSTLGMFALICASGDVNLSPDATKALAAAYFPAICGLHILLDYYIDQEEDVRGGDLNFVSHYRTEEEALDALRAFVRRSLSEAGVCRLSPHVHHAVVRGLLALYLSDPKIRQQGMSAQARSLVRAGGSVTGFLRTSCAVVRRLSGF